MIKKEFIKILRKYVNYAILKDWFKPEEAQILFDLIVTIKDGKEEEWEKVTIGLGLGIRA